MVPHWIFEICVSRTASEYLSSELGIEAFSKKYSIGIKKLYNEDISEKVFENCAQGIIEFLGEIDAGEQAVNLLNDFTYFRLYNEAVNKPRKMKSMFGSILDPVKVTEHKAEMILKSFRAYIFGLRSDAVPKAPPGWILENDEHIVKLKILFEEKVSVLDIF